MPYTILTIVVAVVLGLCAAMLIAPLAGLFAFGGAGASHVAGGTFTTPGGGAIDVGKLEQADKRIEAASQGARNGSLVITPAADLQAMLPDRLGALPRASVSSESGGAAGVGGSEAEGRYGAGDGEIRLKLTDMGAMGALTALGGALGVQGSKQDANGYEKVGQVDGRMTTEKWDNAGKSGSYSTIVADRFLVEAEGGGSIDALKGAVSSVDLGRLAAMAGK